MPRHVFSLELRLATAGLKARPTAYDDERAARAAFTRSGVNGTSRSLAPVASKTAFASAAATTVTAVSPAPIARSFG